MIYVLLRTVKYCPPDLFDLPLPLSAFLLWDRAKVPPRLIPVTEDHDRMYTVLKSSGLDYVAVMPPHIDSQWEKNQSPLKSTWSF